jgi:hypothetical protein
MKSELLSGLFGDYQPENIYALYGVPNAGKTVLVMTEVAALAAQGVRTLWIDTEGGLNYGGGTGIWEAWKPKLEARFGLKDLNEWVEYHRIEDYEELLHFLGYQVNVDYDEKRTVVQMQGKVKRGEETVYSGFGMKRDKCFIVLDSLSSVFRLQFGSTMQNFPGRGDATAYLMFAINKLMRRVNAPLLTTNHAGLNPSKPWEMATMRGGSTVYYYSKCMAYLEKRKKKELDAYRKIWAVRSPLYKELSHTEWLKIDNDLGFVSSSEAEVDEILKATKKGSSEDSEE